MVLSSNWLLSRGHFTVVEAALVRTYVLFIQVLQESVFANS